MGMDDIDHIELHGHGVAMLNLPLRLDGGWVPFVMPGQGLRVAGDTDIHIGSGISSPFSWTTPCE